MGHMEDYSAIGSSHLCPLQSDIFSLVTEIGSRGLQDTGRILSPFLGPEDAQS